MRIYVPRYVTQGNEGVVLFSEDLQTIFVSDGCPSTSSDLVSGWLFDSGMRNFRVVESFQLTPEIWQDHSVCSGNISGGSYTATFTQDLFFHPSFIYILGFFFFFLFSLWSMWFFFLRRFWGHL